MLARRRPSGPAARSRAKLVSFASDQGLALAPALTNGEVAAELERRFGVEAAPWASAADAARFAPASGSAAVEELQRITAGTMAALRRSRTRAERLRGVVSLRALRGR